jgi:hypothetical protein
MDSVYSPLSSAGCTVPASVTDATARAGNVCGCTTRVQRASPTRFASLTASSLSCMCRAPCLSNL